MKKLGFLLMSVMTISFLASCGGKNNPEPKADKCTLTLNLNGCTVNGESTYSHEYKKGETIIPVVVTPDDNCFFKTNCISSNYEDYWTAGPNGNWILSCLEMNDNHTININVKHNFCASVKNHSHLSFTTIDDQPLDNVIAPEDTDFAFKMKATVDESNEGGYKIPASLSIYVGGSTVELDEDYYTIDKDEESPQLAAIVTIKGEKVTGDIEINGEGVQQGYYAVDVSKCFGVTAEIDSTTPPYFYTNEDGTVTFSPQGKFTLPKDENILVKFDNKGWTTPSQSGGRCSYDEYLHKLTLYKNKATDLVMIGARSPEYQILNEMSWKTINDYSTAGHAKKLFNLGDTKSFSMDKVNYQIRIIGFNQDKLSSGGTAGITFEFTNTISNFNTSWDYYTNYHFITSAFAANYNENGEIYKKVATVSDSSGKLINFVKLVKKDSLEYSGSWGDTTYDTKLFPISYDEIEGNKTNSYQYYKNASDAKRKKDHEYWLRTPNKDTDNKAWIVEGGGSLSGNCIINHVAYGVVPTFCI